MNQESLENLVRGILTEMNDGSSSAEQKTKAGNDETQVTVTVADYPVAQKHPDWIKTKTGKTFSDITLNNVLNGSISQEDLKVTPDILQVQGKVATDAGRKTIAFNFDRAAELTAVPDVRLLEMYNALRPYRSSKAELLAISDELLNKYNAPITAGFVKEAAEHYETRKKLKGDN